MKSRSRKITDVAGLNLQEGGSTSHDVEYLVSLQSLSNPLAVKNT